MLAAAAVVAAVATACANEPVGCDFRESERNAEPRCQERSNLQANGFAAVCDGLGGASVEGGCPRDGIVAGCPVDGGGEDVVDWFYAPKTRDEVAADCDGDVLDPP